jgi:NADPH:quinone reductase-like Zn-dependent oxidoreductase
MKAVTYRDYGGPEVLEQVDIETPAPAEDQILVKVHAAALNPMDWHFMRGSPFPIRLGSGLGKPKSAQPLGFDFSGTVEALGRRVTRLAVGDAVFGAGRGALAEFVAARADNCVKKPERLTFEQAASATAAGLTALHAVRDQAQVQPGQTLLINGASGGVGTFAVQLAKTFGAEVTGVQSTRNLELVRSLGADHVIDYTQDDFTTTRERYDAILDNVGNRPFAEVRRVLKRDGRYVFNGGGNPADGVPLGRIARMFLVSPFVSQKVRMFVSSPNRDDLQALADLMQAGKVTPVIDRRYRFSEAAEAIRHLETGHARGKVVVAVTAEGPGPLTSDA